MFIPKGHFEINWPLPCREMEIIGIKITVEKWKKLEIIFLIISILIRLLDCFDNVFFFLQSIFQFFDIFFANFLCFDNFDNLFLFQFTQIFLTFLHFFYYFIYDFFEIFFDLLDNFLGQSFLTIFKAVSTRLVETNSVSFGLKYLRPCLRTTNWNPFLVNYNVRFLYL